MSDHPLSQAQSLKLLANLGPGSPYRLALIICSKPALVSQLLAAWQQHTPLEVFKYSPLIAETESANPAEYQCLAIDRVNQLAESKDHRVVVLENVDQFDDPVAEQFAAWLINYLPQNLTILMTCAHPPRLPLSRLRVRRLLLEIELDE